jgi:hypothetical protein
VRALKHFRAYLLFLCGLVALLPLPGLAQQNSDAERTDPYSDDGGKTWEANFVETVTRVKEESNKTQ